MTPNSDAFNTNRCLCPVALIVYIHCPIALVSCCGGKRNMLLTLNVFVTVYYHVLKPFVLVHLLLVLAGLLTASTEKKSPFIMT